MALENVYLKNKICEDYRKKVHLYEELAYEMEDLIRTLIEENKISFKSITARPKKIESLRKKIKNKNYKYSKLEEITDLSGVRVITYYSDDVYRVEEIIKKNFHVDKENSIDKAKSLEYDRFGYLSLHYVVTLREELYERDHYRRFEGMKFEIQIRSILQDAWAEIEHDLGYKNEKGIPLKIKRDFSRLAGLLELADKEFQSIRDSINNYEDIIILKVKDLRETVTVDDISVRAYINHNKTYRTILDALAEEVDIKKMNPDMDMSKCLISAGITTLNEVEYLIKENRRFLINMIKYERIGIYNYIGEGDILLYICYAKILRGKDTEKKMFKFWEENGYITEDITHEHKLGWIENMKLYMT